MPRPYGLLRAGFPFLKTLGMRRVTNMPMDVAVGDTVVYSKYGGTEYKDGMTEYMVLREDDVMFKK